uniref:Uncharacterized protein n=1 Tax=Physcomitrium patens TaxID=3218 RepID=A0A2K1IK69_PHYPA|nr:hypothetical protein PHYPA_028363 [Physcomitrium patens]
MHCPIEPASEDDWETLNLNTEHCEEPFTTRLFECLANWIWGWTLSDFAFASERSTTQLVVSEEVCPPQLCM